MDKPSYVYVTYILTTPHKVWEAITDEQISASYWERENVSDWKVGSPWAHQLPGKSPDVVGKVLESDETFVGGKAKNAHANKPIPKKHAVHALVERGGQATAKHVADVSAKSLWEELEKQADAKSALHTDDSLANLSLGKHFTEHRTVAHTLGEYVTKDGEAPFRWNTRSSLGIEDTERASSHQGSSRQATGLQTSCLEIAMAAKCQLFCRLAEDGPQKCSVAPGDERQPWARDIGLEISPRRFSRATQLTLETTGIGHCKGR